MKNEVYTINGDWMYRSVTGLQGANPTYGAWTKNGSYFLYSLNNTQESISTPGYRKLKPYQRPENPHRRVFNSSSRPRLQWVTHWLYANGTHDRQDNDGPASVFGTYSDIYLGADKYPGDDPTNQAISRLQSQLNQTSGNLMVTMAEADKTAAHLAHTATRLVSAFRNLKRGRLGDFARDLGMTTKVSEVRAYRNSWRRKSVQGSDMRQFVANSWLEYSYGWKPLLQDFHAQAENLARVMTDYGYVVHEAKASARTGRKVYTEKYTEPNLYYASEKTVWVSNRVSFTVRYRIQNGSQQVANNFGLLNPLEVAWEVIPFSFVADWFLPVGDFLQSLTAYNGLEFSGGTKKFIREAETWHRTFNGPGSGTNPRVYFEPFEVTSHQFIFDKKRTLLTDFPRMTLQLKDPRSFAHAASAIALLQSTFLGSRSGLVRYR